MRWNVLLPNGDVVLCSQDYSLRYVLGNLLEQNYHSLFTGEEFVRIIQGKNDDNANSLCRQCEKFAYDQGPVSTIKEHLRKVANIIRS